MPGHLPTYTPKLHQDSYNTENLKYGFEATTKLPKAPNLVDMTRNSPRTLNTMFYKVDSDYLKDV